MHRVFGRFLRAAMAGALVHALAGCSGCQSALDPQGTDARIIAVVYWFFFGVSLLIWMLVTGLLLVALRADGSAGESPLDLDPRRERRTARVISTAVAGTVVILVVFTAVSFAAQGRLYTSAPPPLTITLTGHQWWWDVKYEGPQASRTFSTANEIHVPQGAPVRIKLQSTDVIHSFWVPNLAGKMDLIPGRENVMTITAENSGLYRGQCAEFCGLQHANMGLLVIADPQQTFDNWRAKEVAKRKPPMEGTAQRGEAIFLSRACMACHTIRGTSAGGRVGPDLTHVGGRRTIAAGTLPMTRGALAGWITDPQHVKPGSYMPSSDLRPEEIEPLVSYLMGLT